MGLIPVETVFLVPIRPTNTSVWDRGSQHTTRTPPPHQTLRLDVVVGLQFPACNAPLCVTSSHQAQRLGLTMRVCILQFPWAAEIQYTEN